MHRIRAHPRWPVLALTVAAATVAALLAGGSAANAATAATISTSVGTVTSDTAVLNWTYTANGSPVDFVRVGRSGTDASGNGPWHEDVTPPASGSLTFTDLIPSTSYTLYAQLWRAGVKVAGVSKAVTTASSGGGGTGTKTLPACTTSGATGAGSPTRVVNVAAPGTGDQSGVINNAIAGATSPAQVVLAAGTYHISSPIVIRSGIRLTGQGDGVTTVMATTALGSASLVRTAGNSNITIEKMTLDQQGSIQTSRSLSNYLLDVDGVNTGAGNVIVQNVATRNPSTYSMVAHNNASGVCFRNNDVRDTNTAGNFPNLDGIHTTHAQNVDILNNYVDQMANGSTGGDDGIAIQVESCGSGCWDSGSSSNINISGNVVRGGATAGDFDFAISGGYTISGVKVNNNEFWGGPDGIRDADFGGGGSLQNVQITSNWSHNHAATPQQSGLPKRGYTLPYQSSISQSSITVDTFRWCNDAGGAPQPSSGTSNGVTATNVTSYSGCTDAPNITSVDANAGTGAV